jgi:hypothetical protein
VSEATFAVGNFLGGEISKFAQGRFDKPDYRNSLKVCLNSFPGEIGTWMRRPGTQHGGFTRGGAPAKKIKFDFEQAIPYTLEFTDGFLRFHNGAALITTDTQVVVAVSAANPAVVQTTSAVTWATGDTLIFPGASTPLLENRQFLATKVDTTHFSLADAITGTAINGASLGALVAGATVSRVQELTTVYAAGAWSAVRAVQAETTDILLNGSLAPQALTVTTLPTLSSSAVFAINPAIFNDGPYLDPFINGVQATPNAVSGSVTLTLGFAAYVATQAYAKDAFVTSVNINYKSLIDNNVGNTPAGAPTAWAVSTASAAINDGKGFLGTDVGRLVRLFSEPAPWLAATGYVTGNIVAYNPTGTPGATTYWTALAATTGNIPGTDLTHWSLTPANAALWSWGKITGLSTQISQSLGGVVNIGNMILAGGIAAPFNGNISQVAAACASDSLTVFGHDVVMSSYVGQNFTVPGAQKIASATVYPSSDVGFAVGRINISGVGIIPGSSVTVTLNLRASQTAPSNSANGTLLGTSGEFGTLTNAVTIQSNDQTTAWKFIWIEIVAENFSLTVGVFQILVNSYISQIFFYGPAGSGVSGNGVNIELLGPPLLYTVAIRTWRLGAYSNTTGWPTCGTYYEGRLWLSGAVANRFDGSVSNGILGGTVNFSPTDQNGVVAASSAISYTLNSDTVNPIFHMTPDLQGIIIGTQGGEWLVVAPTAGPIAPNNIAARNITKHGSSNILPCRTEHTNVFVQRFARKLLEYFPDVYSGKFSAPNLADKAQHVTRAGVSELAYTNAMTPILWGRDALGALFGVTYKRDTLASAQPPTFYGWHRHTLGSGRIVESICNGPSVGGDLDSLTMVTNDAATGLRHVEILTDTMDEDSVLTDSWFLDDAVTPTSTSSSATGLTINGLWHLNGKTVQVFAGGLDCGDPGEGKPFSDFLVTNGSVFVPYGDSISAGAGRGLFTAAFAAGLPLSQIVVGFTYNSDGQMVKPIAPADSGARNGPALGKLSRAHRYAMLLVNTLGLQAGGTFAKLRPAAYETKPAALTMFTGIAQDGATDDDGYDNGWCWRVSRPFPANVTAVALNLNTKDQ